MKFSGGQCKVLPNVADVFWTPVGESIKLFPCWSFTTVVVFGHTVIVDPYFIHSSVWYALMLLFICPLFFHKFSLVHRL